MNIEDVKLSEAKVDNRLKAIFDKQNELVKKYKEIEKLPDYPFDLNLAEHQDILKSFMWRGVEEIAEAIEAFRKNESEHFKEELIDALHFFTELAIVSGKDSTFFRQLEAYHFRDKTKLNKQSLYYNAGLVTEKFGLIGNTLKNKKWKQSQVLTDQTKYFQLLQEAYDQFIRFLFGCGLTADDIYNYYCRKKEVNEFRIRSKY